MTDIADDSLYSRRERQSDQFLGRLFRFHGKDIGSCNKIIVGEQNIVPIPTPLNIPVGKPLVREVIEAVAHYYNLHPNSLYAHDTAHTPTRARQIAFFIARQMTGKPDAHISRLVGGRDRTSVVEGCKKIANEMSSSARLADDIDVIKLHIRDRLLNRRAA